MIRRGIIHPYFDEGHPLEPVPFSEAGLIKKGPNIEYSIAEASMPAQQLSLNRKGWKQGDNCVI